MAREQQGMDGKRGLLLGIFVIVAVVGGMVWMGGQDKAEQKADAPVVDDNGVEVVPLMNESALESASWHRGQGRAEAAAQDEAEREASASTSLLDKVDFESDGTKKANASLERVVSEIHGLGVYVAEDEPEETKAKAPTRKRK